MSRRLIDKKIILSLLLLNTVGTHLCEQNVSNPYSEEEECQKSIKNPEEIETKCQEEYDLKINASKDPSLEFHCCAIIEMANCMLNSLIGKCDNDLINYMKYGFLYDQFNRDDIYCGYRYLKRCSTKNNAENLVPLLIVMFSLIPLLLVY